MATKNPTTRILSPQPSPIVRMTEEELFDFPHSEALVEILGWPMTNQRIDRALPAYLRIERDVAAHHRSV